MNTRGVVNSKMCPVDWERKCIALVIYCWEINLPKLSDLKQNETLIASYDLVDFVSRSSNLGLGGLGWHRSMLEALAGASLILQEVISVFFRLWTKGSQPQEKAIRLQKQLLSLCSSHLWYFSIGKSKLHGKTQSRYGRFVTILHFKFLKLNLFTTEVNGFLSENITPMILLT